MKTRLSVRQRIFYQGIKLIRGKAAAHEYRELRRPTPTLRNTGPEPSSSLGDGPVVVIGLMSSSIGLGVAARKLVASLRSVGLEPQCHDVTGDFNLPRMHSEWRQSIEHWPEGGTIIFCLNPIEVPIAVSKLPAGALEGRWLIGYFWWELEAMPQAWKPIVHQFDEVWASSGFVYSVFATEMSDLTLGFLPISVRLASPEPELRTGKEFVVLSATDLSSWPQRKNPEGAIKAFLLAFGDDPQVRLILKIQNAKKLADRFPHLAKLAYEHPNIELVSANVDDLEFEALIKRAHVVLSLHRAEGLGLVSLEAMALGKVVMATNWGGPCDYLDVTCAVPIGYKLRPVRQHEYLLVPPGSRWAEPDIYEAARWLRILRDNPTLCHRLGAAAQRRIGSQYGQLGSRYAIDELVKRPRQAKLISPHQVARHEC